MIYCFGVCIARVDVFECFFFIDFARYDIDIVGYDFIGCCVCKVIDECWYIYGKEREYQWREVLADVISATVQYLLFGWIEK